MENIYANKLTTPTDDFGAVRDGRTSPVFYLDIDLATARTAANPLILDFAGNSFYVDANPADGNAVATFMQRDTGRADCPFYVSPGFIVNLPFTRIMFQNTAQPTKKIRVFYGVDVDFQPGAVSQIAVTNAGGFTGIRGEVATGSYASSNAISANVPETVFTPASNVNGAIILSIGGMAWSNASQFPFSTFIAKSSAPTSVVDGEGFGPMGGSTNGTNFFEYHSMNTPQTIAPGLGFYFITGSAINGGHRYCRFKLL